ncbi:MAG: S53 family peptidase [Frankia sp.]
MGVSPRRLVITAAAVALAIPALALPASAAGTPTKPPRLTLSGSIPAWATAQNLRGDAPANRPLEVTVNLALRDPAAAEAAATAVADPASPSYGHYLSAAQFKTQYGATDATVNAVRQWLTSSGLAVLWTSPSNRALSVIGSVGTIEKTFGTDLKTYSHNGAILRAPSSAVTLPSNVAGTVLSVSGLTQSLAKPSATTAAPPTPVFKSPPICSSYYGQKTPKDYALTKNVPTAYGKTQPLAVCGYTAKQVRGLYGTSDLVKTGVNGRGTTVAVVDAYNSPTIATDANKWAAAQGEPALRPGQLKQVVPSSYSYGYDDTVNGDQCGEQGWYGEQTLDVEAVHGMAPGANITYVAGASCQDSDLNDAVQKIVDYHLADIVTNSYGDIGEDEPADDISANHATFIQAALSGIGIFFSSGDDGDEVVLDGARQVDYPASDPFVTAVGGTTAGISRTGTRQFELGWETATTTLTNGAWTPAPPGTFQAGGGGGVSKLFTQPAYQRGIVPTAISEHGGLTTPHRAVPDIAALGDPNTGYLVGQTQTFSDGSVKFDQYRIGGTSLSSPLFAGMEALAQQTAGHPLGFANPTIYRAARTKAFYDPASSDHTTAVVRVNYTNNEDASQGYGIVLRTFNLAQTINLRPGYDDVTGVGTVNGPASIKALAGR